MSDSNPSMLYWVSDRGDNLPPSFAPRRLRSQSLDTLSVTRNPALVFLYSVHADSIATCATCRSRIGEASTIVAVVDTVISDQARALLQAGADDVCAYSDLASPDLILARAERILANRAESFGRCEELARQRRHLQASLDNLPVPIFFKDETAKYSGCNAAFKTYVGLSADQIIGKTVYEVSPLDLARVYEEKDRQLFKTGTTQVYEARAPYADGSVHDVVYHRAAVTDDQGKIVGLVGGIFDITDRKELEAKLQAESSAKTRFLASASHDLRQPIHAIGLNVGVLRLSISDPEVRQLVDKIQRSVNAFETLLSGLLDISKLDSGVVEPKMKDVALQSLFDYIALTEMPAAKAKQIELSFVATRAVAWSDPAILERILRNLIENAVRYTERGKVLVGVRRRRGAIRVEVHDTGIGIATDQLEKIFQEFYQVGNAARDPAKGLGLGLSIVQRSAQLLGHPIQVKSRFGKGSTFSIELPCAPAMEREAPPLYEDNSAARTNADVIAGAFFVVIEDDAEVRLATTALLKHWGCHVLAAESYRDAKEQLHEHLRIPDAIVSDYRLPDDVDGISAIDALCAEFGEVVPALLITGDLTTPELDRLERSGVPVLYKPVSATLLHSHLSRLLLAAKQTSPTSELDP